jgi:hypothetical protein
MTNTSLIRQPHKVYDFVTHGRVYIRLFYLLSTGFQRHGRSRRRRGLAGQAHSIQGQAVKLEATTLGIPNNNMYVKNIGGSHSNALHVVCTKV